MRALVIVVAGLVVASVARAQPAPRAVTESGLDEHVGAQLPLSARFAEPYLGSITLGQLFDGKRPVLLVMAYARCTMLCSLVLRGAGDLVRKLSRRDYQLVLVGLDARETIDEASRKQASLLSSIGADADPARWFYLIGSRASIDAVADALGFRYAWDERTQQYAHPAVIFAISPDGRVARYLHGVEFAPDEVSAALDDAAAGRFVASPSGEDIMRCFHFDPALRRAGARVQRFLRAGAVCVFVALVVFIGALVLWDRCRGGAA